MKRLRLTSLLVIGLCLLAQASWGTQAYVTDSSKITLRTGPSVENKIIALLTSGEPLDVLNTEGDWSYVRTKKGAEGSQEGWVLTRYLMDRVPWEIQAKSLKEENGSLKERLAQLEGKWSDAAGQERQTKAKLDQYMEAMQGLQKKYDALKSGAETYLSLKENYEALKASLDKSKGEIDRLTEENRELRSSQMNRWVATGALILLCGLLIGVMVGRQQKKRRAFYD